MSNKLFHYSTNEQFSAVVTDAEVDPKTMPKKNKKKTPELVSSEANHQQPTEENSVSASDKANLSLFELNLTPLNKDEQKLVDSLTSNNSSLGINELFSEAAPTVEFSPSVSETNDWLSSTPMDAVKLCRSTIFESENRKQIHTVLTKLSTDMSDVKKKLESMETIFLKQSKIFLQLIGKNPTVSGICLQITPEKDQGRYSYQILEFHYNILLFISLLEILVGMSRTRIFRISIDIPIHFSRTFSLIIFS